MQGTARMVLQTGVHPAAIKDSVTSERFSMPLERFSSLSITQPALNVFCMLYYIIYSIAPGGCTIAGLLSLEDNRVRSTIARAVQVATVKAHDLGQPATDKS